MEPHEASRLKTPGALAFITALFVTPLAAAWAWFHFAPPPMAERLVFQAAREIPGWRFERAPIGAEAREILSTTNLFNGIFTAADGRRVTVFAAAWRGDTPRSMTVVHHTPDICWVGAGWRPIEAGQPDHITLLVGGREVAFECRIFSVEGGGQLELVVWCTLLSGEVLRESSRWSKEEDSALHGRALSDLAGRRLAASQFLRNVALRRSGTGEKQFMRFSTSAGVSWQEALEVLRDFAPRWLSLRVVK